MAYRDPVTGQILGVNTTDYTAGSSYATAGGDPAANLAGAQLGAQAGVDISAAIGTQEAAVYTFRWLLAWAIVILLLSLVNRTSIGHTILYYLLALSLFFLIVTQYRWFAAALSPITGVVSVQQTNG